MSSENINTTDDEKKADIPTISPPSRSLIVIQPAFVENATEAEKVETAAPLNPISNPLLSVPGIEDRRRSISLNSRTMRETIDSILKKNDRTDEETLILFDQIKDFKFFNQVLKDKNEPESVLTVVKSLKYRKIKAGRTVFTEGDPSNGNVFVVFSGELLVMVKKLDSIAEANLAAAKGKIEAIVPYFELPIAPILVTQSSLSSEDLVAELEEQVKPNKKSKMSPKASKFKRQTEIKKDDQSDGGAVIISESDTSKVQPELPGGKDRNKPLDSSLLFNKEASLRKLKKSRGDRDKDSENDESPHGYVKDKIIRGGSFGEIAIENGSKRTATILASTDCELLILTANVFNSLKNEYDRKVRKLLDFITVKLPGLNQVKTKNVIKNYFYLFEEKEFYYGNHITNEGDKGDNIYIIYEGSCEVYRTVRIQEAETLPVLYSKIKSSFFSQAYSVKEKIPLTILKDGALIGEELLFCEEEPTYCYSIQVTSDNCKVVCVNKDLFAFRFPKEVIEHMKEAYEDKKTYKNNLLKQNLEKRDIFSFKGSMDDRFLIVQRTVQQDFGVKSPKINASPSQYISYKLMMTENTPNDESVTSPGSGLSLPKITKAKNLSPMRSAENETKKKLMPFSRVNLMPLIKDKEKKPESALDQKKEETVANLNNLRENTRKSIPGETSNKKYFVDHIRKSDGSLRFHNMGDVYESIGAKLNLNPHLNVHRANVNNVDYYKLDFGKSYDFEERSLYLAKNTMKAKERFNNEQSSKLGTSVNQSKHHKNSASLSKDKDNDNAASMKKLTKLLKGISVTKFSSDKGELLLKFQDNLERDPASRIDPEVNNTESVLVGSGSNSNSPINKFSGFEPSFLKDFSAKPKENPYLSNNRSCDVLPSYRNGKSNSPSPKHKEEMKLDLTFDSRRIEPPIVSHNLDIMDLMAMKEALSQQTNLDAFKRQALPVKNLNVISPISKVKQNRAFLGKKI